jgi:hypothetical protein
MTASTRSRWLIGSSVAAVVVVVLVLAYVLGESRKPGGFGGLQLVYIALGVLIPLFVYVFGVGPLSALDGAPAAEAGAVTPESLEQATVAPAVAGAGAEKETAAGAETKS